MLHETRRPQPADHLRASVARFDHPEGAARKPHARAVEMAETMREILFRDGCVTEAALVSEGYTAAEIVEHAEEARRHVGLVIAKPGESFDRMPAVIAKAGEAIAHAMPMMAGALDGDLMQRAWRDYCTAVASHRLDPWVAQTERCLSRLKIFLTFLPIIEREKNSVIASVAAGLKRKVAA